MSNELEKITTELIQVQEEIKKLQVLIRVNNIMTSRFIMQLQTVRKELGLPKRETFFRFELLSEDYDQLVSEFGKKETDKALYKLDRLLLTNRQECPNNIKKYIRNKLKKNKTADDG